VDLKDITLDTPIRKCRRKHSRADRRLPEYKNCHDCRARNRYVKLRAQDERRRGVYRTLIDVEVVQEQVDKLIASGHTRKSIAAESGVSHETISTFMRGGVRKVHPLTYDGIMSVKPSNKLTHRRYKGDAATSPAGTIRRIQGLYAQGWNICHMAEILGVMKSYVSAIVRRPHTLVTESTVEKFKRLAEKLGGYDLNELDAPLPGMSYKALRDAARKGWLPLSDWDGIDIDDPAAEPHRAESLDASNGMVLVDQEKVDRVLDMPIQEFPPRVTGGRSVFKTDLFTEPMTKLEQYEIIRQGSLPNLAGQPRFSANLLHQRIGIDERSVQRRRADLVLATRVVDQAPPLAVAVYAAALVYAAAEYPWQSRVAAVTALLDPYPLSERVFESLLVILTATQPAPFGRGWSDERLADWLGCTVEDATALRSRAVIAARRTANPGRSSRHSGRTATGQQTAAHAA
jgi:hypothetical protein